MASHDHDTELYRLAPASPGNSFTDLGREAQGPSPAPEEPLISTPSETFNGPNQLHALLFWQTLRWLGTVVLVVFLFATIKIFQNRGNFDAAKKNLFNVLNIALSLALGYNFNVLLFLATGSSIALLNLAYSTQDGVDWNGTYTRIGTVKATDLSCYFPHRRQKTTCPADLVPRQAAANLYGEMGVAADCGNYTDISEVQNSRQYNNYYCRRTTGSQEFAFRFYEYNPDDQQRTYPFFTNRIVTASAGECIIYPNVTEPAGIDLDGDPAATNYTFTNGSFTDSISIPRANVGLSGTTYIYRGIKTPGDADSPSVVCGPRCLWMWVYKAQGPDDHSTFYKCPITISNVSNASYDYQKINNIIARTAAASIALHGSWTGKFGNRNFTSFNFFAADTDWDVHDLEDASTVGALIAEFSIASLSTMAAKNPSVLVPSNCVPHLGTSMKIEWHSTIGLFVFIVGLHAVVAFAAVWAVKDVVV